MGWQNTLRKHIEHDDELPYGIHVRIQNVIYLIASRSPPGQDVFGFGFVVQGTAEKRKTDPKRFKETLEKNEIDPRINWKRCQKATNK